MKNVTVVGGSGFIETRLSGILSCNGEAKFQIVDKVRGHAFPIRRWLPMCSRLSSLEDRYGSAI